MYRLPSPGADGIGGLRAYVDQVGMLRDIAADCLMLPLSLIAMGPPCRFEVLAVERAAAAP
jgi:glucose-6-phosphate 1-dehydrogenase